METKTLMTFNLQEEFNEAINRRIKRMKEVQQLYIQRNDEARRKGIAFSVRVKFLNIAKAGSEVMRKNLAYKKETPNIGYIDLHDLKDIERLGIKEYMFHNLENFIFPQPENIREAKDYLLTNQICNT